MKTTLATILLILLCSNSAFAQEKEDDAKAAKAGPAVKGFEPLQKAIREGFQNFIAGTDPVKAFQTFNYEDSEVHKKRVTKIREQLKAHKVKLLAAIMLETKLYFVKKDTQKVYVKMILVLTKDGARIYPDFLSVRDSKSYGTPLDSCKGSAACLKTGLTAFVKRTKESKALSDMPYVSYQFLKTTFPFQSEKAIQKALRQCSKKGKALREAIQAADYDTLKMKVDDVMVVTHDKDGRTVGHLEGDFDVTKEGTLTFELKKFEEFEREEDKEDKNENE